MTSSTITATLTGIPFRGDNNFIIGNFLCDHKKFSGLGNIMKPMEGMDYRLVGKWSNHSQYGKQFRFSQYQAIQPLDANSIYIYLVREVGWVGPTIANTLIDIYGDQTLEVLRNEPEIVSAEIRGLTLKKAKEIQEQLVENENIEAAFVELMGILDVPRMPHALPMKLIHKYKSDAVDILRSNPYILTQYKGVGFSLADAIAIQKLKIEPDSNHRIISALEYILNQYMRESGSTWMKKADLIHATYLLISVIEEKIEMILDFILTNGFIREFKKVVAFHWVDDAEDLIVDKIKNRRKKHAINR